MIKFGRNPATIMFAVFVLMSATIACAQTANAAMQAQASPDTIKVQAGQKMNIEGVIIGQQADDLIMRGTGGGLYKVALAGAEIKEKKSNPFRGAKGYTKADLIQGLHVEVKGTGDSSGSIVAREIRFRNDDAVLARTMDARVVPVENDLRTTQARLGETEQNAQRLSGQVRELAAITDIVRDSAQTAQTSADGAMSEAKNAKSLADTAKAGVKAANERITSLDNYDIKNVTTVSFKVGSSVLQEKEKAALDKVAEDAKMEKGFLIEVAGFASSEGDEAFNRRLSQKRADAVIQYLAENYSIPLRRFVMPMGYGEKQPIADNATLAGRKENRRVEVRVLVSKGLVSNEDLQSVAETSISAN